MSKDYNVATVSGTSNFPVTDITHKPKRQQADMLKLKQQIEGNVPVTEAEETAVDVPNVLTLERAISFYKRRAGLSELGKLYEATAKWLEELLVIRSPKTIQSQKEAFEAFKEKVKNVDKED